MMTTVEILNEIQKLPSGEQQNLLVNLQRRFNSSVEFSEKERLEAEVDRLLLAEGLISEIPSGLTNQEEEFDPIEIKGKPLSEIILEDRR